MIRLKGFKPLFLLFGLLAIAGAATWAGFALREQWVEQKRDRQRLAAQQQQILQAQAQQRQAILQNYGTQLEMALNAGSNGEIPPEQFSLIQALTFQTLNQLDGSGRGEVIRFLYRKRLIGYCPQAESEAEEALVCEEGYIPPVLPLVGADLRRATLRAVPLSGVDLRGTDLRGADLRNAQLNRANLNRANLSGADLSNANLQQAELDAAYLRVARLNYAILEGAVLTAADLQEAQLTAANLKDALLEGTNFQGALLSEADLAGADLTRANFSNADLSTANFSSFVQRGGSCSDFDRWISHIASVEQTDFSNANLSNANLVGLMTTPDTLNGAVMTGANLTDAKIGPGPSWDDC
ncbi:MAG: pentapeptide repeat-containing protein [Elainellaceae cyanobacterium]